MRLWINEGGRKPRRVRIGNAQRSGQCGHFRRARNDGSARRSCAFRLERTHDVPVPGVVVPLPDSGLLPLGHGGGDRPPESFRKTLIPGQLQTPPAIFRLDAARAKVTS